jgi:putative membrane protein
MKQRAAGTLGLATLGFAWMGPLPEWSGTAFFAHMSLHMLVVAVAAPLIALGVAGTAFDPVARAPRLFAPVPASVLELIVVWTWHAPGLHHWARHHAAGMAMEQGMFLVSGLLLWISALGGRPSERRAAAGVIGLLLTSMHMTLLGALLALSPRPLYAHAQGAAGLTAMEDQHLGGAIMLAVGGIVYFAGGLGLTAHLLKALRAPAGKSLTDPAGLPRVPETGDALPEAR